MPAGGGRAGEEGFGFAGAAGAAAGLYPQGRAFILGQDPSQLIVIQTAEVHGCIEALLRDLRAAKKIQVQVDVRFIEVGSDFMREVGFDWSNFVLYPNKGHTIDDAGIPNWAGFQAWNPSGSSLINTGIPFFGVSGSPNPGLTLNFGWNTDALRLTGLFRLADQRNEVRTLSAPRIVLANGQAGYIIVATDYTYVATYDVNQSILTPSTEVVSDAVSLTVRPVVSYDLKYVFLELLPTVLLTDLTQSVSFQTFVGVPGGTTGGAAGATVTNTIVLPRQTTKTLATTVGVPDRGILVVGGLSTGSREQKEAGLPILDKIPIIKRLFAAKGNRLNRAILFILARPQIIILPEEEATMM
jgi:general secretion pathway protein D